VPQKLLWKYEIRHSLASRGGQQVPDAV
jgi:hypothetical protein